MSKKAKIKLTDLSVKSFETTLQMAEKQALKAGALALTKEVCSISYCLESPCNITQFGCEIK